MGFRGLVGAFCLVVFLSSFALAAASVPAGPFMYEGGTFYAVNGNDPNLDSGTKVCNALHLQCVGYTDLDSAVCRLAHRGVPSIFSPSESGSKSGFYCNGLPQQGECAGLINTCDVCPQCNVGEDCNSTIGSLYAEMFVQCAPDAANATLVPVLQVPVYQPAQSSGGFFSGINSFFSAIASFFASLFGGSPASAPSGGSPSGGGSLCPLYCYLHDAGTTGGASTAVNCNVDSSSVHKALSACPGTTSDVGSGSSSCSCQPVAVVSQACPVSCSGQDTCNVNPGIAGASNIPCDGSISGSSQACKCIMRNGNWVLGSQYGVR